MPYGFSLSPVFAEFWMQLFEDQVIKSIEEIQFYRRYVDDTIVCIPKSFLQTLLGLVNSYHPALEFKYEEEENGTISFLDILIMRQDDDSVKILVRIV